MKFVFLWDKKRNCFVFPFESIKLILKEEFFSNYKKYFLKNLDILGEKNNKNEIICFYKSLFENNIDCFEQKQHHYDFLFFDDHKDINPIILFRNHIFNKNFENETFSKEIHLDTITKNLIERSSSFTRSIFYTVNLGSFHKKNMISFLKIFFLLYYVFFTSDNERVVDFLENLHVLCFSVNRKYDFFTKKHDYVFSCDRENSIKLKELFFLAEKNKIFSNIDELSDIENKYKSFFNMRNNFDLLEKIFLYFSFIHRNFYRQEITNMSDFSFVFLRHKREELKKINKIIQDYDLKKLSFSRFMKRKILMSNFSIINYVVRSNDFHFLIKMFMDKNIFILNDKMFYTVFEILNKTMNDHK